MRNGFGLAAGFLVAAWLAAAAFSPPPGSKVVVSPRATTAGTGRLPPGSRPKVSLTPGALPLTANECTDLGGTVTNNEWSSGLCASKKLCVRTDNKGVDHAVCLEVGQ